MKNLCCILLLFLSFHLWGQENPQWVNYTCGLDVKDTHKIGDKLWIATDGGLVERDLIKNKNTYYNRGNSPLPSNYVFSVEVDSDGLLWGATDKGIFNYDGTTWNFFDGLSGQLAKQPNGQIAYANDQYLGYWNGSDFDQTDIPHSVANILTTFIIDINDGTVWLSYFTYGSSHVLRYKNNSWDLYDHTNSPLIWTSTSNNQITLDDDGNAYLASIYGLSRFNGEEWFHFDTIQTNFPHGGLQGLTTGPDDHIWALIVQDSLQLLVEIISDNEYNINEVPTSSDHYLPNALHASGDGLHLYLGRKRDGCWAFDHCSWTYIPSSNSSLSSNNINQIYLHEDVAWIHCGRNYGLDNNNLYTIDENAWTKYSKESLPFSIDETYPPAIVGSDPEKGLWVHTGDTLMFYDDGEWSIPAQPDIMDDVLEINSFIHYEPDGSRWLLEKRGSIFFYEKDDGNWEVFPHAEHGSAGSNYGSYFSHPFTNDFWISSYGGIAHFDGENWDRIRPEELEGIYYNYVPEMVVDKDGIIWAAARRGLLKIENNIASVYLDESAPVFQTDVYSLEIDAADNLWVGMDSKIAKLENGTWTVFDQYNSGVPNSRIQELTFDTQGNLWIGTSDGGFAIFNPTGLADHFLANDYSEEINDWDALVNDCRVFPNPGKRGEAVCFDLPADFERPNLTTVTCYNSTGQLVFTTAISPQETRLSATFFEELTGIYYLHFENETQQLTCALMIH